MTFSAVCIRSYFYFCSVSVVKGSSSSTWPLTYSVTEDDLGLLVSGTNARFIGCDTTASLGFRNSGLVAKIINLRSYLEPEYMRRPTHVNIRM